MEFHGVNAKVRAMSARLLKREEYETLCHMASVEQLGRRLRENPGYRKVLAALEGQPLHRAQVERQLPLSLYEDFNRLRYFFSDKGILDFWASLYTQYQVNFLKILLCAVFDEREADGLLPEAEALFARENRINSVALTAAKTVPDFIEQLKATPLYTALTEVYARQPSLFALERQMDLYYYLHLWKKLFMLPEGENRQVMRRIKGTEIDLLNILWVYRLKRYFNINDTRIYAYLIPINHRLRTNTLRRMAESDGTAALLAEIADCPYGAVFHDFSQPEQSFARAMGQVYAHEARRHPGTLAVAAAYLFLKEQEIRNITTTLEGVRYGLPAGEIMAFLSV